LNTLHIEKMKDTRWPPIHFSAVLLDAISDKAPLVKKVETAISSLKLSDYGAGLKAISFITIAVLPSNKVHEESITYYASKKAIDFHLKLDYPTVAEANETRFLQLTAQLFLRGLREAPQEKITDFNWAQFQHDTEQVFMEKGWVTA